MKWQDASKVLGTGTISLIGLFSVLFMLTGIDYTFSGDIQCDETCESYINLTTSYWRVCFANYSNTKYKKF